MARSLNKVTLIGNLTRDPELRYTPQQTAVCTFGLATNRSWSTDGGDKKEDVEYHRIVAWQKLGELCSQLLSKGRKVYVEGRLQTRKWTGQDEVERTTTEIVINEMIILDSKGSTGGNDFGGADDFDMSFEDDGLADSGSSSDSSKKSDDTKSAGKSKNDDKKPKEEEDDDIPF